MVREALVMVAQRSPVPGRRSGPTPSHTPAPPHQHGAPRLRRIPVSLRWSGGRLRADDLVDPLATVIAGEGRDVQLAGLVLAERGDLERLVKLLGHAPGTLTGGSARSVKRPDPAGAEVAKEVEPLEARVGSTPVNVAAGDGAAAVPTVLGHRTDSGQHATTGVRRVAVHAFHDWPAEVEGH